MNKETKWHAGKSHNIHDQVAISDELTGRTIAIAYDKADAPLIAAAPELLEALEASVEAMSAMLSAAVAAPLAVRNHPPFKSGEELLDEALFLARATIANTKIQN